MKAGQTAVKALYVIHYADESNIFRSMEFSAGRYSMRMQIKGLGVYESLGLRGTLKCWSPSTLETLATQMRIEAVLSAVTGPNRDGFTINI